ncbi:uncharacterized protein CXQ87_003010 [Candidozyma duobushaemuli]|uniref:FAD dependent oxidoreductase domain-containing protein n=1 Tax=Candidozyma duobushaemuli TaxID=1231522 RepID=A0A2V1AD23_9ASCO|nr:uncharacterized protein CXQ87_003010 [[Candida] duobushaemulonis]PVH15173.1 hypothetical protein CXQ87_003010 [[Candida] duobushaemulonis]
MLSSAGIIGHYTAYKLLEQNVHPKDISIIGEFLPGDESIKYTSPYAGGNFSCITGDDPQTLAFDEMTYKELGRLQHFLGGYKCGLDRVKSTEYWDTRPSDEKLNSLESYLYDLSFIPSNYLPDGVEYGIEFITWNFNCPKFLVNFQNFLVSQGVTFERKRLDNIRDAFVDGTKVVFNCTGLGSRQLGGVNDPKSIPYRGQVVVIKAPHIQENVMRWGNDKPTYIIKRPNSNDQLILGGYLQKNDWTPDTFRDQTLDILQRTTKLYPKILEDNRKGNRIEDLEILRVVAGLRPGREGGVRIEKEFVSADKVLVHNYGAAGYGYQAGLGMADKAVSLALGHSKL